ncbi:flavin reductase family protein [Flavobacterium sp. AG291]|uniref:flavin reductase family protein n=1 Tax=Flavobacterium sp. AG291 TaxID=2184000 RepID=UPI000E09F012|nr:flavin reductase family protein [Flavobacterium sp. AG291]RDI14332.1 flavin reductase (DIM6/NTAB) family NADH-FMN oxidoreductase RutF [Flavobacterium sp. AG291]
MKIDPAQTSQKDVYKILTGSVIPRPIGWISSISKDGYLNLAPFSFFNAVGEDPPHVMFSTVRSGNTNKDTLNNVLETKQFVVNMATEELVEAMNATSVNLPPDGNEFEFAGLTPIASDLINPPRVKESPISFECELVHHYNLEDHKDGGATIMIGRIVMFHVDESVLLPDYKINMETYRPIARLAGYNYAKLGEIFAIKRPFI